MPPQMVHLTSVSSGFHGKVIAARLGADGILTQLRGPADGPYPVGAVEVLVPEDELADARALLRADAAEAAGAPDKPVPENAPGSARRLRLVPPFYWVAVILILATAIGALGRF